MANMSADTRTSPKISAPVALLFAANALAQFAIQAVLAYGFGAKVWGLAKLWEYLPLAVPVALDIFAITLMVFAYQLRQAPLRQRIYVWVWLGVAIACQIGAAEGFAEHEGWGVWGRGASLFPSIFLAASLHALIIATRKVEVREPSDAPARVGRWVRWRAARKAVKVLSAKPAPLPVKASGEAEANRVVRDLESTRAGMAPVVQRPERPSLPPAVPPVSSGARPARPRRATGPTPSPAPWHERRGLVIKRCLDAVPPESAKDVALSLGLNPRTVQLWVKQARDERDAAQRDGDGIPSGGAGPETGAGDLRE